MIRKTDLFWFLRTRLATPLLALLALFFGAWTPQGFMPMHTEQGFAIVLCSGYGPEVPLQDSAHTDHAEGVDHSQHASGHGDHDQSDMENSTCTYAGAAGAGLDTSGPDASDASLVITPHEPERRRHFAVRNRLSIPPATGPPALV
ncbi:hypothetical protein SAMN02745824_2053 [Parasphingorhabdus marina DSM 22363]|uniref:DUF2946 domain-containing protein n=1 Tax=Parasphingorhabdus marina DSM 22363 TaxID=1123272 RepID=A0A1N6ERR1_9SPHN|nr:DUF2946 family protein [Parasphingorhabdus marina]SIN85644.1 hypothetical protein SAMN02745824_2053 [Parasphingorhabdus marina DSM 22363]